MKTYEKYKTVFDEAENGDFSNLALLNNPDFEVDALNEKGCSLLHYAIGHNNPSTGEHLIKYFHANPNIATVQSGRVPLHLAVDTQNINSVRMLLDCEADPNIQAKMGKNTPMHLAAAKHQHDSPASLEILKLLIEAGTKVSILNSASLLAVDCLDSKTFDELLPSFTKYIDTGNTVEEKQKRLGETISELIFATQYYSPEPAHPMTNLVRKVGASHLLKQLYKIYNPIFDHESLIDGKPCIVKSMNIKTENTQNSEDIPSLNTDSSLQEGSSSQTLGDNTESISEIM